MLLTHDFSTRPSIACAVTPDPRARLLKVQKRIVSLPEQESSYALNGVLATATAGRCACA